MTRLLLSRSYNKALNSIDYCGKGICEQGFSLFANFDLREVIADIYKIDRTIYDVMYPYCKGCKFCDRDALPALNPRAYKTIDFSKLNDEMPVDDGKATSFIILAKEDG